MPRKKAYKYKDPKEFPVEVGDWVLPTNLSVGKYEPAYQVCLLYTSPSPRDRG